MSAAAPARPRLLRRPVSDAQGQAARRNGARSCGPRTPAGKVHSSLNARRHGFYAKLHLFTPEETEALREETQYFIESFRPVGPVAIDLVHQIALATFQMWRINQIEVEFQTRNPRDFLAIARQVCALGVIENRYMLLRLRCLRRLDQLTARNLANEPGNLLKQRGGPTSVGAALQRRLPSHVPPQAPARQTEVPGTSCGAAPWAAAGGALWAHAAPAEGGLRARRTPRGCPTR